MRVIHDNVDATPLTGASAVSAGSGYSLALMPDRRVFAWGANDVGRFGDGTVTGHNAAVPAARGMISLAAGGDHVVAITERPTITTTTLPRAEAGVSYSVPLDTIGGAPPYVYSTDVQPPGIVLGSDGRLTGVPAGPGSFSFTVTVSDSGQISGTPDGAGSFTVQLELADATNPSQGATVSLPLRVVGQLTVTTAELPQGEVNKPYSATLGVASGTYVVGGIGSVQVWQEGNSYPGLQRDAWRCTSGTVVPPDTRVAP